jgi:hypothetical protein
VSQIVLTYVLSESQLEEYANRISKGDDGFPDDELEVIPGFNFNAPPMIALGVMLQDDVSTSVTSFESVQRLRENEIPLLLAFHLWDRVQIVARLEEFASDPATLGAFYEEFFSETWDDAPAAMLEACRFVQSGVEALDETACWFLLFVS